jgi:hypothetical protein
MIKILLPLRGIGMTRWGGRTAAGEQEKVLVVGFGIDEIRTFRDTESGRRDYRRRAMKTPLPTA